MSSRNALSDTEKREKKIVEKKLMEMEEELKVSHLRHPPSIPPSILHHAALIRTFQLLALSENLTDQVRAGIL